MTSMVRCRRSVWWLACSLFWLQCSLKIQAFCRRPCRQQPFSAEQASKTRLHDVASRDTASEAPSEYSYDPTLLLGKQVPLGATILSKDPLIYLIRNLLSQDECNEYMERVERLSTVENRPMTRSNPPDVSINISKLWPLPFLSLGAGIPPLIKLGDAPSMNQLVASVFPAIAVALLASTILALLAVPVVRLVSDSSSRTSDAMAFNMDQDVDFIRPLVDRVCNMTQHPWHAWEAPVVTRYKPGAIFAKHGDASPMRGSEWVDTGGQRVVTCICYLNTVNDGGETSFDRQGINVKPIQGSALVFYPANVKTLEADDRTIHESLAPMEEKWIMQMFGRIGPRVPPPLGLPDSFFSADLSTDEGRQKRPFPSPVQ